MVVLRLNDRWAIDAAGAVAGGGGVGDVTHWFLWMK
jgi:hypothetical protein